MGVHVGTGKAEGGHGGMYPFHPSLTHTLSYFHFFKCHLTCKGQCVARIMFVIIVLRAI